MQNEGEGCYLKSVKAKNRGEQNIFNYMLKYDLKVEQKNK